MVRKIEARCQNVFPAFHSLLSNHQGNTLLGVLVAGVVGALIASTTYRIITSQIQAQKLVGSSSEQTVLRAQIQGILSENRTCRISLKDVLGQVAKFNPDVVLPTNPTPAQLDAYQKANTLGQIKIGSMVVAKIGETNGSLRVDSMGLQELDSSLRAPGTYNNTAITKIIAKLQVYTLSGGNQAVGNVSKVMEFPIQISTDNNSHDIVNCSANFLVSSDAALMAGQSAPNNYLVGGRLTYVSASPVADKVSATTLYYTPQLHNQISVFTNNAWEVRTFPELTLSLAGLSANTNYDVFIRLNNGALELVTTAWTNGTTRATALARQDGVLVSSASSERRYLGTLRTTTAAASQDDPSKRFLWNYYNRTRRAAWYQNANPLGVTQVSAWHVVDANARVEIVVGQPEPSIPVLASGRIMGGCGGVSVKPNLLGGGGQMCASTSEWNTDQWPSFAPALEGYNQFEFKVYAGNAGVVFSWTVMTIDFSG